MKKKFTRWLVVMMSIIMVLSTSLGALAAADGAASAESTSNVTTEGKLQDGTYEVTDFTFVKKDGTSKRTFTLNDNQVVVRDGVAYVTVTVDSTSMPYVLVNTVRYDMTINASASSASFEIPTELNKDITVDVYSESMDTTMAYVMHVTVDVPSEEPEVTPVVPTVTWQDGTYTGTGSVQGGKYPTDGYDIDVTVEIKDGKIVDVRYTDPLPNDTNLTYKKWVMDGHYAWDEEANEWTYIKGYKELAVETNSADVDVISRATKTSGAVKTAMMEALEKAETGDKDTATSQPTDIPETQNVIAPEGVYNVTPVVNGLTVVDATLTSEGGKMTALITLSATGNDYLYFGTETEAYEAGGSNMMRYIGSKEYVNASGTTKTGYQFLIPVESLDKDIEFISHAYSTNYWFYRTIRFDSAALEKVTWQDGSYTTTATVLDGTKISGDKYPATGYQFLMTVDIKNGGIADVRYAETLPNDGNISYKEWAMDGHYQYNEATDAWTYVEGIKEQAVTTNSPQIDVVSTATKVSKAINVGLYAALEKAETGDKDTVTPMPDVVPETENVIADTGVYKIAAANVETTLGLADTVAVELTSQDGKMMALVTWSSNSGAYDYLYVGTEEEAYQVGKAGLYSPVGELKFINSSGKEKTGSQFLIPITSLDKDILVLAHAKSSDNWFHRTIKINSEDLILVDDLQPDTDTGTIILPDGTYSVTVDTGAKMFKVVDCKLVVEGEEVTAVVTLSSKGYDYLYAGTAAEAEAAGTESWSKWVKEIPSGDKTQRVYTLSMSKEDLTKGLAIASHSESNKTWFDRNMNFDLESMKVYSVGTSVEDAINNVVSDKVEADSNTGSGNTGNSGSTGDSNTGTTDKDDTLTEDEIQDKLENVDDEKEVKDGTYKPEFGFTGGSGRATISCSKVVVKDGKATATITFNSPNFTWVKSLGKTVTNENKGGNSTFTIPVNLNGKTNIVAETTAMSQPYEVEYTLYCFIDGTKVTTSNANKSDDVIELEGTTAPEKDDAAAEDSAWGSFYDDKESEDAAADTAVVQSNDTLVKVLTVALILVCIYAAAGTIFAIAKMRKMKGE